MKYILAIKGGGMYAFSSKHDRAMALDEMATADPTIEWAFSEEPSKPGRKTGKYGAKIQVGFRLDPDVAAWLAESDNKSALANRCLRREMYRIKKIERIKAGSSKASS